MSNKSTKTTCHPSISCVAGGHARTSANQEKGQAWMVTAPACISNCTASYAKCGPEFSSWRTCQLSLVEDWTPYCGPWQKSGSLHGGAVYDFPHWVPLIDAKDGSVWVGWPTPTHRTFDQSPEAFDRRRKKLLAKKINGNGAGKLLAVEVRRGTKGLHINPSWVEQLMGFPVGWTSLHPDGQHHQDRSTTGKNPVPIENKDKTGSD